MSKSGKTESSGQGGNSGKVVKKKAGVNKSSFSSAFSISSILSGQQPKSSSTEIKDKQSPHEENVNKLVDSSLNRRTDDEKNFGGKIFPKEEKAPVSNYHQHISASLKSKVFFFCF